MLKKPDSELKPLIYEVFKEMQPLFSDVELAAEVKAMERLGSIPIPRIGELSKKLQLVDVENEKKAIEILKGLMK